MAAWLAGHAPWYRPRHRFDLLHSPPWLRARNHLNIALQTPSPASLEVESMPYPTTHPDHSVFEPMSEEYASVSMLGLRHFRPLSSSETLASLVSKGSFQAADALRKELVAHHVPIPRDVLYLRAALHAITQRRTEKSAAAKERVDAFGTWLSLAPDRHEVWQSFHDIRQRLFRSMDHLNLTLVYQFGLVLASKGYYSGDAAMQVVSTLARYARPSDLERYLCQLDNAVRDYHLKTATVPPSESLSGAYNLSIRTVALGGKGQAALGLVSVARSRGTYISDFTLNIVAKHAPDRQTVIDRIQAMYPSWIPLEDGTHRVALECEPNPVEHATDIAALAARLRALRNGLRSPRPPSPHALRIFIASYHALGRTRAPTLLRALAYRHSPKSASTWAFAEMLHHRSRREPIHLLLAFSQHFHLIGVPRKSLLSFIRGTRGKQARRENFRRLVVGPCPSKEKLWPSAYHTALVWEALVVLSPWTEKERLYALLLSLVRRSRQPEPASEQEREREAEQELGRDASDARLAQLRVPVEIPPNMFDSAHFSPFVSSLARSRPARAASVLRDMVSLGIEPSIIQWSMVARGCAQHDDPKLALRFLDRLEEMEREGEGEENGDDEVCVRTAGATGEEDASKNTSDALLGVHTNVLRGFVIAGDVKHAREVERRLVERLGYRAGDRPATDASFALLRGLEMKLGPLAVHDDSEYSS